MSELFPKTNRSSFCSTKSLTIISIIVVVIILLALTYVTPVSMGISIQQGLALFTFKDVHGHDLSGEQQHKEIHIYPCDDNYRCADSNYR